jgi:hypothetical protein
MTKTSTSKEARGQPHTAAPKRAEGAAGVRRIAFILDAGTGQVDRIEMIERDGARRELSGPERAALVKGKGGPSLEAMLEEAFIAGIDSVLGDGVGEDEGPESEGEKALERSLLRPMMQRSAARRLMRREVLRQAVLQALVQDVAARRARGGSAKRAVPRAKPAQRPRRARVGGKR